MGTRFFTPFKGDNYEKGICGKKILVLGASFYCNQDGKGGRTRCKFFEECTDPLKKDSSMFNETCPYYAKLEGHPKLEDEPTNSIWSYIRAYQNFAKVIIPFIDVKEKPEGWCDYDIVWDRMAFTDYVQFFLPSKDTYPSYFSKRDFNAFMETLRELKPDVVIAWGLPITAEIRDNLENNSIFTDLEKLSESEHYVCHMRVAGVDHEITYVSCYHPSSAAYWYNSLDTLSHYLKEVFK